MNYFLIRAAYVILLIATVNSSCIQIKKSKNLKERQDIITMLDCQKRWKYKDLVEKERLKVLYFAAARTYDIYFNPNCVIGVNQRYDTIALIDPTYPCPHVLMRGELVDVAPLKWKAIEKESSTLMGYTDADASLLCSIDTIYYGEISW